MNESQFIRVLLIEDNPIIAALVQELLEQGGPPHYEIVTVERLGDGLQRLRTERYDAILTDLSLPDAGDLEAVVACVAQAPDLPIVVLTASDDERLGARAVKEGAQDYLFKEAVTSSALCRALGYAMERQRWKVELRKSRDELEKRVAERTVELTEVNRELQRQLAERQRAEEALQEQAALLDLAHDAIIVRDLESRIVFWSHGAEETYGWTKEEALAKVTHTFLQTESSESVEARDATLLREGRWAAELVHTRHDGTRIVVISRQALQRDSRGNPKAILEINRDITARKDAEETLRESNRRLEEALKDLQRAQSKIIEQERLRALGEMASGIAHDFNNALGPILGFSELLLMREQNLDDREKTVRYLRMMNTGAKDAASIVSRLREFYRKRDEGEVFLPIELNHLVEEAVSLTQPRWKDQALADGKTVRLSTQLGAAHPIFGNEHQLREVLTNLIFNAVDALTGDGEIVLRTYQEGDHVVMEVRDTGSGMSEEVRQRCLEPFFSTKGERGTGLGLSMVYGIVRRHDGTVDIESEVGCGTKFSLRFPVPRAATTGMARAKAMTLARPMRILVVDDEPGMRETVSEYLVGDGHTVVTANDGHQGLREFHDGRFDLVVTDLAMPEMNGDQLAATIKQMAPGMPIIMLTGFGDFMNLADELPEGVALILSKPVTLETLQEAVVKVTSIAI